MKAKKLTISSWGRSRSADMTAFRPERLSAVVSTIKEQSNHTGIIAYGDGRNYGDLGMRRNGCAIISSRLDRFLSFDKERGVVAVETGVTFAGLHAFASARGFLAPVVPGTAFVTLGGAVASDIHGKNHDSQGCLGEHIEWLDLVLASGEAIRASRTEHPDLFSATIGGCGLTGFIAAIGPKLKKLDFLKKREALFIRGENFFNKYGWSGILIGRLIPAIRPFIPFIAGISSMKQTIFLVSSILACLIWSLALAILVLGIDNIFKLF